MNASIHTHKAQEPTIRVNFDSSTDWNPWFSIVVTPTASIPLAMPEDVTVHLDGLSIEEGYAFSDSYDEVGHAIREWVNYRSSDDNEDVAS